MKAAYYHRYGTPDGLEIGELPAPTPGPKDVLIAVHAAGVNPLDWKIGQGVLRPIRRSKFPLIVGNELAGVIEAIGEDVHDFVPGDEVFARLDKERIGAFAELAVVPAEYVARKPRSLSFEQAAAIPLAALTAWQALTERGKVGQGARVLIHAGAGGVGSFGLQLARILGAKVATTASPRNHDLVRELGADTVVDYRTTRFEQVLGPQDVVVDTVGGDTLTRSFQLLGAGGHLITVAGKPDGRTMRELGTSSLLVAVGHLLNLGNSFRARSRGCEFGYLFMRPDGAQLSQLGAFVEEGRLRPLMDEVFDLKDTAAALARSRTGRARGKIVVRVR